ncbi:hypothetical protein NDU88_002922 [Pleurodeles waltl]|uniref:Uncharacterized protein n=1 Tax=Pleurodeles waltl TaxID=8319 RepID=A0AAV7UYR3_PLEWA|nr:hypothetical protein NDU88_002922 [Pleurodeles waltl]
MKTARTQRAPEAEEEQSEHSHRLCGCAGGAERGRQVRREEVTPHAARQAKQGPESGSKEEVLLLSPKKKHSKE